MADNDKNYIENSVLRVRLPMKASELERIIRVHCEHHGVWDDCIVKSAETDRIRAEKAAKDAEIARLRSLVGELAYALDASCDCHCRCDGCKMSDESKFDCPDKAWRALVARAGEMIEGAK